jgi:hypothetical protein
LIAYLFYLLMCTCVGPPSDQTSDSQRRLQVHQPTNRDAHNSSSYRKRNRIFPTTMGSLVHTQWDKRIELIGLGPAVNGDDGVWRQKRRRRRAQSIIRFKFYFLKGLSHFRPRAFWYKLFGFPDGLFSFTREKKNAQIVCAAAQLGICCVSRIMRQ